MNSIPILIINRGNPKYLNICLKQAHYSNPNSRIILLGDETNKNCLPFVEWHNMSKYYNDAKKFESIYQHFSYNPLEFERFCFSRWFIANEFMKAEQIDQVLIIDSDVMVYTNFEKERNYMQQISDKDIVVPAMYGTMTVIFNNQDTIKKLCDYIISIFTNKEILSDVERISKLPDFCGYCYGKSRTIDTNIMKYKDWDFYINPLSDMTVMLWFLNDNSNIKNVSSRINIIDNKMFNDNMMDNYYLKVGTIIDIIFKNKLPYAYNIEKEKFIQFNTLHFQSCTKKLMQEYATYDKDDNFTYPNFQLDQLAMVFDMPVRPIITLNNPVCIKISHFIMNICCIFIINKAKRGQFKEIFRKIITADLKQIEKFSNKNDEKSK